MKLGGIIVTYEMISKDYNDLELVVERKLYEHGLVPINDKVSLYPHHSVIVDGKCLSHFIVTSTRSLQRFFL